MTMLPALTGDLRRVAATGGGEYAGPCPWCGGKDRFHVWPTPKSGRPRFWCRRCERKGDDIDLLRELKGLSFHDAARLVGRAKLGDAPSRAPPPLRPPNDTWQGRAEAVAVEAERALWSREGTQALSYLRHRGFTDETIRAVRLGYISHDRREGPERWGLPSDHRPVWLPRGITIPWRAGGSIWRLNIRRPSGKPKYIGPAGNANGLYGADGLHPGRPAMIVEGEFDALAVAQEAGGLVDAVATGSTCGARHTRWRRKLVTASVALVAYDADDAGEEAAAWWLKVLPRVHRLIPDGDPSAMLQAGMDLREWVANRGR